MKELMTLDMIRQRLEGVNLPDVQRATGLAYNTLKNIRDGNSVMYHTVVRLSNYFHETDQAK